MTNPQLITTPFAENGTKNTIPESGSSEPQLATMQAGFPEITQRPISDGGIPPDRADFNGILNMYGQHIVHLNKGLAYEFDQDFADKIGGYPLNARVMLSSGEVVQNTQEGNTNNPNISMGGWKSSAVSKDVTVPTYKTAADGVNPVTGVSDGAYFNVRSEGDDTVAIEYQNVGGVATPTDKSYLSALGVQQQEKPASTIKDASGKTQQEINDLALAAKVNLLSYRSWAENRGTAQENWLPAITQALSNLKALGGGVLEIPSTQEYPCYASNPTVQNPARGWIKGAKNITVKGIGFPVFVMNGIDKAYIDSVDDISSSGRDIYTVFSFLDCDDCHVEDVWFRGNWDGVGVFRYASPRAKGVGFIGSRNCTTERVFGVGVLGNVVNAVISQFAVDGFYKFSENIKINNSRALRCLENGFNFMGGTKDCTFSNNVSEYNGSTGFEGGGENLKVFSNTCRYNKHGGMSVSSQGAEVYDNTLRFNGSTISGESADGTGLNITSSAAFVARDIRVHDNFILDNKGSGIWVYPSAESISIYENDILRNATANISNKNFGITAVGTQELPIKDLNAYSNNILDNASNYLYGFNGSFIEGGEIYDNIIRVGANKSAAIIVQSSCSRVNVFDNDVNKSVSVSSSALNCAKWNNAGDTTSRKIREGSAVPTTGTWERGDFIKNTQPSVIASGGRYIVDGWVCTQDGSFIDLAGVTANTESGSNTVTVNSSAKLAVGMLINIAGDGVLRKITSITGTSIVLATAPTVTVSSATMTTSVPVFHESRVILDNYGKSAASQVDSVATDVATLRADFNSLLAKMRAAGQILT